MEPKDILGQEIDRLENMGYTLNLPLPNDIHVQAFRESLPEIVAKLKEAYVGLTSENAWE